ncbi:CMRF35-like molecule 5 precursor, partial [Daubentonia madagascariensis]
YYISRNPITGPDARNPVTGPGAESGPERRDSLTVQCRYDPEWETYRKWRCQGADWGICRILVVTTGSEQEMKEYYVSLGDSQKDHMFNVTMEELGRDNADTCWCGVKRIGDLGVQVKVTIDTDTQNSALEKTTTVASLAFTPSTSKKTASPLRRSLLGSTYFLLLVLLELPLLLSMLVAVIWMNMPWRSSV